MLVMGRDHKLFYEAYNDASDLNGDGHLDLIGACELAHLVYAQNPGNNVRSAPWKGRSRAMQLGTRKTCRPTNLEVQFDHRPPFFRHRDDTCATRVVIEFLMQCNVEVDYLRDGIYELRASQRGVQYRILYFFSGQASIVVSHGLVKERVVPPTEIERALKRKTRFLADPTVHTFRPTS